MQVDEGKFVQMDVSVGKRKYAYTSGQEKGSVGKLKGVYAS